jgi:hypothetical protein
MPPRRQKKREDNIGTDETLNSMFETEEPTKDPVLPDAPAKEVLEKENEKENEKEVLEKEVLEKEVLEKEKEKEKEVLPDEPHIVHILRSDKNVRVLMSDGKEYVYPPNTVI